MVALLLLSVLCTPAEAHVPHEVILAIAPSPGLDPAQPWWLLADHDEAADLYRSDDGGRTWIGTASPALADPLVWAVTLEDGTVVLVGPERAWWSAGEGWDPVQLPFEPTGAAGADRLYLGGADGAWAIDAAGGAAHVWEGGAVERIFPGYGGVVAVAGATVAWTRGGDWASIEAPPDTFAATLDDQTVYAGTLDGRVFYLDGEAWRACGTSPLVDEDPEWPGVVRLASDGTTLVIAHADTGPALSTDQCRTWTADPAPINLVWESQLAEDDYYDFTTVPQSFTALAVGGDRVVVGTYDGTATRIDGTWLHTPLKGADYPRGTAFSRSFAEDGLSVVAAYGCGVQRGFEWGMSWDCPGQGIDKPGCQGVAVPMDAVGLVPAYALSNRVPVRSDDGGATWTSLGGDFGSANGLEAGPDDRLWIMAVQDIEGGAPGDSLRSVDGGSSWEAVDGFSVLDEGHAVLGVVDRGDVLLAYSADRDDDTPESVYLSSDGDTWDQVHEMKRVDDILVWPEDAPTLFVAVGPEGIDIGNTLGWRRVNDTPTRRVAVASDGTLAAVTRTGNVLWSDDSGESWTELETALAGQAEALVASPLWESAAQFVAMTPAGAFVVDRDGNVERWIGMQQADDQSHYAEFVTYDPFSDDVPTAGAMLAGVHALPMGSVNSVWLRGTEIELVGGITGPATLRLTIDGAERGTTSPGDAALGEVIASADGLEAGLHLVTLEVLGGDGVVLDAARGIEASHPLGGVAEAAVTVEAERCGCGSARGSLPGVALALLLLRRRDNPRRSIARTPR